MNETFLSSDFSAHGPMKISSQCCLNLASSSGKSSFSKSIDGGVNPIDVALLYLNFPYFSFVKLDFSPVCGYPLFSEVT